MIAYRVTWEIDAEANTPVEAARQALEIMRDPESIATVFVVQAFDDADKRIPFDGTKIDLTAVDDGEDCRVCGYQAGEGEGYNGLCDDCVDKRVAG